MTMKPSLCPWPRQVAGLSPTVHCCVSFPYETPVHPMFCMKGPNCILVPDTISAAALHYSPPTPIASWDSLSCPSPPRLQGANGASLPCADGTLFLSSSLTPLLPLPEARCRNPLGQGGGVSWCSGGRTTKQEKIRSQILLA